MAFSTASYMSSKFLSFPKTNETKGVTFSGRFWPKELTIKVKRGYSAGSVKAVYDDCRKLNTIIGIDLGTTNSVAASAQGPRIMIVPNSEGSHTTPSVVAYTEDGDILVGESAKKQGILNPENTLSGVKRFIGKKMSELDEKSKQVPYQVVSDDDGNLKLACPVVGKHFTAEEVSAQILRKLVDDASKFLNNKVTGAVITIPAHFSVAQLEATKEAGRIAGLELLRIMNEPTAASMGYGFLRMNNEIILVFDLGGGTFDVSVIEAGDGVFEVLSVAGDSHLGGADFDKRIVDWLASNFKTEEGIDLLKDKVALQRLTMAAEDAKMKLSSLTRAPIWIPGIATTADGHPKHIKTVLSRIKFDELCWDLFERFKDPVESALRDANLSFQDLDEVILVGGSTCIPAVMEYVKKLTGLTPNAVPNPDEVVALGAAYQGNGQCGEVSSIAVLDVTPFSIGLETCSGFMTKIIPGNTTLPASASAIFSTVEDGQTSVEINVLEGEGELARNNKCLGKFRLGGIQPSPRGVPQIEVKFDIDADGILSAVAVDKRTGKKQDITVTTWHVDEVETEGDSSIEKQFKEMVDSTLEGEVAVGGLTPVMQLGEPLST